MLIVETDVAGGNWPAADWERLAAAAVSAALAETPHAGLAAAAPAVEVSVRLTDNDEVHALNRQYRGKDKPTNVLSFPMVQADLLDAMAATDDGEILLGDIVLAAAVVEQEAAAKAWPQADYAQHLIVHGMLHLLGYDHETGEREAVAMEALETAACAALGLPDPYDDKHE